MGVKIDSMAEPDAYRENLRKMGQWLVFRSTKPFLHSNTIYRLSGLPLILNKYLRPVHQFSSSVIQRRRDAFIASQTNSMCRTNTNDVATKKKLRFAMLDSLLAVEADDRKQIDEAGIREEVDTFMFEGYDTTSAALTFCLLMLAHHLNEQNLVVEEIERTLRNCHSRNVDDDSTESSSIRDLNVHDYGTMEYLDCFIRETLRLYPPVSFMGRELTEPMSVCDLLLPAGTQVHIHAYDLHRDPEQFPEPETFNPDRFLPQNRENRHPFAYLAFSAGPRNCIGK